MQITASNPARVIHASFMSRLGLGPKPHDFVDGIQFRYLTAMAIGAAVLGLAVFAFTTRGEEPSPGIYGVDELSGTTRIAWVMAGGYAAEAGLRPGDVVRRVPVPAGSTAWQAYQVVEGPLAGRTIALTRRWTSSLDLALLILGLEFLVAGLVVHVRAANRGTALRFTALAAAISGTLVTFSAVGNGVHWALAWEWFGSKVGMAAFCYFFLTVPVPRWRLMRTALLWSPVPILTGYVFIVLARPDLYVFVKVAGYSYMSIAAITSIVAMVWPFVTAAPASQRRLLPVAAGTAIGVLIYLLGSLLPFVLFRQYLLPAEIAILGLGLLPLGLLWAVLRYPVMGLTLGPSAVLNAFFESTSDPMFVVGGDGYLLDASRAGRELLRLDKSAMPAEQFDQLIARLENRKNASASTIGDAVREALAGGDVRDAEVSLSLPGGEPAHFSVDATPLLDESGSVGIAVLAFKDITPRKLREYTRQELERQKDEFLANVSHDLRTPIAAIKYSVSVVLANRPEGMSEPMSRLLFNIDHAADRMASQVNDLLDLARLQAGQVDLNRSYSDIRELLKRAAETVGPLASSRGQSIGVDLPSEPCWLLADQSRLERAITNLTANAYRYGKDGGTIQLRLLPSQSEVRIAVTDDGPGIPEDEQQRIFDRFYRGSRHDASGCGLGLPIARGVVELHGGSVWVESEKGAGSTFWISLPAGVSEGLYENTGSR